MAFGENILQRLADRQIILPILENQMRSDTWPDKMTFEVDTSPYYGLDEEGNPDGWFHPSSHSLKTARQLYYEFHPEHKHLIEREPWSMSLMMASSVGSSIHAVLQTQLQMAGMCGPEDVEPQYDNVDHHVRGRGDVIVHHPTEGPIPVEIKALALDTPVFTPVGWSTMGDLSVGDEVFAPDGQPTKVLETSPVFLKNDCYRVTMRDGQSVVADGDHRWLVRDVQHGGRKRDRSLMDRVMTTREIASAGVKHKSSPSYRFAIPVSDALQLPEIELPIDPWLLGMWLGDGDTRNAVITCGRDDLPYLRERLDALGLDYDAGSYDGRNPNGAYRVYIYGLRSLLISQGLLGNKHIPERYLRSSEQQRRQLLAGLLDSDGTCGPHQVAIGMVNEGLMRQVLQLTRSVGYRATWKVGRGMLNGQDKGPVFWVKFSTQWGRSPFDMPRKHLRFEEQVARGSTIDLRLNSIVSVEPVASVPSRCITVAHESSLFLAGEGFLPTHNSRTAYKFDKTTIADMPSWEIQLSLACDNLGERYDTTFDYGILLMVEAGWPFRMRELRVPRNDAKLAETYAKFDYVRECIRTSTPPPYCCSLGSDIMKSCAARHACWLKDVR